MINVQKKIEDLGYVLPYAPVPVANYVPYVVADKLLFVSGQISRDEKQLVSGCLGRDLSVTEGQAAARICALNILAQIQNALEGDWTRFKRLVRLGGFVNAAPDFYDHALVLNGASDLMVAVFGDAGIHARAAVGCSSLPLNAAVEIEALVEIAS